MGGPLVSTFFFLFLLYSLNPAWDKLLKAWDNKDEPTLYDYAQRQGEESLWASWILFDYYRHNHKRINATLMAKTLLEKHPPPHIVDECLQFSYQILKETQKDDAFWKLWKKYKLYSTPAFQRTMRIPELFWQYKTKDRKALRRINFFLTKGKPEDRLALYNFLKKNTWHWTVPQLIAIRRATVRFQRWDLDDEVKKLLAHQRLSQRDRQILHYLDGRRAFRENQWQWAINYFKKAQRGPSTRVKQEARYQEARMWALLGKKPKAKKIWLSLLGSEPTAAFSLARLALGEGNIRQALDYARKAKNKRIRHRIYLMAGALLIHQGKLEQGRKVLKSVPDSKEKAYWEWRSSGGLKPPPSLGLSYFQALLPSVTLPKKLPEACHHEIPLFPKNFGEYLLSIHRYKEAFPLMREDWDRCKKARIYKAQGFYHRAIQILWPYGQAWQAIPPEGWEKELKSLLYPEAYREEVQKASQETGVPQAWLWAVIRQESAFNPSIVSPAGAVGLMQLLPKTADKIDDAPKDLMEPSVNIRLGANYLASLYDAFNHWFYVVAAYNAGEDAVKEWLKGPGGKQLDLFYTFCPYAETRRYLNRVVGNWLMYRDQETARDGLPRAPHPIDLKKP